MTAEMGGLIRMTVHDVVRGYAAAMIWAGAIVAALGILLALVAASDKKIGRAACFAAVVAAAVLLMVAGTRQPRRREITCCASGPISLEAVAAVYDIIEVDGKLIRLAER